MFILKMYISITKDACRYGYMNECLQAIVTMYVDVMDDSHGHLNCCGLPLLYVHQYNAHLLNIWKFIDSSKYLQIKYNTFLLCNCSKTINISYFINKTIDLIDNLVKFKNMCNKYNLK